MLYLSHRGNIKGSRGDLCENSPEIISDIIEKGYNVEIDVWMINYTLFLGHNVPLYKIEEDFLNQYRKFLLCHAKNAKALEFLLVSKYHCFWHEEDKYTLTNYGVPIIYPGQIPIQNSIVILPEKSTLPPNWKMILYGICSDYIYYYNGELVNELETYCSSI